MTFESRRNQDAELEYQLLLARIDFVWESPLKNAQTLVNFAPSKKKVYKYFSRLNRSKGLSCSRAERRKMHELFGDSLCSCGGDRNELLEHAVKHTADVPILQFCRINLMR
ncbi:unnamed protein product [Cylicocyclus nassatus]|uniref:Uncharacterized protein n=1 Tax=Cylicocyclus nassatus TaxID=53992 RepID=A0AA36MDZ5_CYLNA|nr:unnamed protein product [Cylicocyclus nassatus]